MRCEVCGCEHDGSYGSGRFCSHRCKQIFVSSKAITHHKTPKSAIGMVCPVCGIELSSKLAFKKHRKEFKHYHHRKTVAKGDWECSYCGKSFRTHKALVEHKKSEHVDSCGRYECRYCGRAFSKAYQIAAHTARCKLSPNYEKNVEKSRNITRERFKDGLPEETKKISDKLKKFYAEHPESASYKYNHYSKGSWAEDYFRDLFAKENIVGWESQYHVLRYRLDFAFIEEKIDFEVDGHQHRVDARIVKHDIERTKNLEGIGWTVVRILWRDWNKMTKDEKHRWLEENLYCRLNQFRMDRGRTGYAPDFGIGVAPQKCDDENGANSTNSARADNDELRGDEPKCVETIHPAPDFTQG